jgi:cobalt-zinc-cadmium efflux system outer membrane protein
VKSSLILAITTALLAASGPAMAQPPGLAVVSRPAMDAAFALALPDEQLTRETIGADPEVQNARAGLDLSRAQSRQLAVGDHEIVLSGSVADRRVRGDTTYREYGFDLSRAIRLPGKGALDRRTGALGEEAAAAAVDDARHQTGLRLSALWFDWIEAGGQLGLDRETEASLEHDAAALRRRVELQDAATVELEQALAALAAARGRRAQAEGALEAARLKLSLGFPGLPLPIAPPRLPEPAGLDRPLTEWAALVVERSHEIEIVELLARQADARAARARLDRLPDPTIGVRTLSERGGDERSLGVYISTPIGVGRRSALSAAEAARAAAAQVALVRVRREVEIQGLADAAAVNSSQSVWRGAAAALEASEAAARRIRRGFDLGEFDLQDMLLADRQLYDARRSELASRAQAWRALVSLRLDAHDLWAGDDHAAP